MTTITFVRHGNTHWNREKRSQGHSNNPLNEIGIKQANAVAKRLAKEEWDMVISSDLLRAKETLNIIVEQIKTPKILFDQRLREIDRGQISGTIEEERVQKWGENWRTLDLGEESKDSVRKRGLEFVEDMARQYAGKNLLVVSHGILIGETLKGMFQDETKGVNLENTSVTKVELRRNTWECSVYNCAVHLQKQELSDIKQ
ncbi:histidine phosphatase family protein [Virgibacillus doumboii]|uniref:histidine phosphatase family protein n=1 Tax=Virgibacillus doumboii TaxID=2697503 RepID=UPI0013DF5CCC|nr:histidine phosphatase family protein [Virgibacillus doumboii]